MKQIKKLELAINRRLDGFKELKAEVDIINLEREKEKCAREEYEREQIGQVDDNAVESVREAAENLIEAHLSFVYATDTGNGEEEQELIDDDGLSDIRAYKTDNSWSIKVKGKILTFTT